MTIDVIRQRPPELARCRAKSCRRLIEWVTTASGARMPLDVPVQARWHERDDGTMVTVVDSAASHFRTCPEASKFRRDDRTRKPVSLQRELFKTSE